MEVEDCVCIEFEDVEDAFDFGVLGILLVCCWRCVAGWVGVHLVELLARGLELVEDILVCHIYCRPFCVCGFIGLSEWWLGEGSCVRVSAVVGCMLMVAAAAAMR